MINSALIRSLRGLSFETVEARRLLTVLPLIHSGFDIAELSAQLREYRDAQIVISSSTLESTSVATAPTELSLSPAVNAARVAAKSDEVVSVYEPAEETLIASDPLVRARQAREDLTTESENNPALEWNPAEDDGWSLDGIRVFAPQLQLNQDALAALWENWYTTLEVTKLEVANEVAINESLELIDIGAIDADNATNNPSTISDSSFLLDTSNANSDANLIVVDTEETRTELTPGLQEFHQPAPTIETPTFLQPPETTVLVQPKLETQLPVETLPFDSSSLISQNAEAPPSPVVPETTLQFEPTLNSLPITPEPSQPPTEATRVPLSISQTVQPSPVSEPVIQHPLADLPTAFDVQTVLPSDMTPQVSSFPSANQPATAQLSVDSDVEPSIFEQAASERTSLHQLADDQSNAQFTSLEEFSIAESTHTWQLASDDIDIKTTVAENDSPVFTVQLGDSVVGDAVQNDMDQFFLDAKETTEAILGLGPSRDLDIELDELLHKGHSELSYENREARIPVEELDDAESDFADELVDIGSIQVESDTADVLIAYAANVIHNSATESPEQFASTSFEIRGIYGSIRQFEVGAYEPLKPRQTDPSPVTSVPTTAASPRDQNDLDLAWLQQTIKRSQHDDQPQSLATLHVESSVPTDLPSDDLERPAAEATPIDEADSDTPSQAEWIDVTSLRDGLFVAAIGFGIYVSQDLADRQSAKKSRERRSKLRRS